jgi:hypothetical protein
MVIVQFARLLTAEQLAFLTRTMSAIREGAGASSVAMGTNGIGKVWRPDFKSVDSLMRDKTFRGDPGALRAYVKQWDGVMEGLTSLRPDSVIPDDHRNVLIWSTLDHNVAETMDSKTVMVNGVEQRLKTHGTYHQVMAALKEEYKDANLNEKRKVFKNNHHGAGSDYFEHTDKNADDYQRWVPKLTIKARELSIGNEEMGELLYNKLYGVMRSVLMRMNVNVDDGITVATLRKVGIQFMNSYTVERESSMKVSRSKARVNATSGDARNHGGNDELAHLVTTMKKMQQSHEQMLQQQQHHFEAQIVAMVPHVRQQGQQSITTTQPPSSHQYDNRDHTSPTFNKKARCSITSDRADCTITTRYRAALGTVPRSSKDTKSKLSAPEAQFVKCEASL